MTETPRPDFRLTGRRTVPRFKFDGLADMMEPITKAHTFGRITEISKRGYFAEVPTAPAASQIIQLRIAKGGEIFTTLARELYNRAGSGVGLRFIDTTPDQAMVLTAWLDRLEKG